MLPGIEDYVKNIPVDNFSMAVTVLAVGQGACNMIEIYDKTDLKYLAVVDLGGTTRVAEPTSDTQDKCAFVLLRDAMRNRAACINKDPRNSCKGWIDTFFLSHQDSDHWNLVRPFLKYIKKKSGTTATSGLGMGDSDRWIGLIYLSGFAYGFTISGLLSCTKTPAGSYDSGILFTASHGNIKHLTLDNAVVKSNAPPAECGPDGDLIYAKVDVHCLFTSMETYPAVSSEPTPKSAVLLKEHTNYSHPDKWVGSDPAHIRNQGSAILQFCVTLSNSLPMLSFIFTGDVTYESYEKIQTVGGMVEGETQLMTIPHHGSAETSYKRGNQAFYDQFLKWITHTYAVRTMVASAHTANVHKHPDWRVLIHSGERCVPALNGDIINYYMGKEKTFYSIGVPGGTPPFSFRGNVYTTEYCEYGSGVSRHKFKIKPITDFTHVEKKRVTATTPSKPKKRPRSVKINARHIRHCVTKAKPHDWGVIDKAVTYYLNVVID